MTEVILSGKNSFGDDCTQNYPVFQPIYKYFRKIVNTNKVVEWKSKGLSDEAIKIPPASGIFLNLYWIIMVQK